MNTRIYPSPIYGPVRSRRLGISLGINLLPPDGKVCSFNCIYCECGLNEERKPTTKMPTVGEVTESLRQKLLEMAAAGELPDVMTFAGNGEPTMHPSFPEIIDSVIALRDALAPNAKIAVLSNGTMLGKPGIAAALEKVDDPIIKVDTCDADWIAKVDQPVARYSIGQALEQIKSMRKSVIIQTMFLQGIELDNTTEHYINPWLEALKDVKPRKVMIYTVDRPTPVRELSKVAPSTLDAIAERVRLLGIECSVSY